MYFMMNMTEDGLRVEQFATASELIEEIHTLTNDDIRPEYRAQFIERVPEWTDDSHLYFIVRGDVVVPEPVNVVTEWAI